MSLKVAGCLTQRSKVAPKNKMQSKAWVLLLSFAIHSSEKLGVTHHSRFMEVETSSERLDAFFAAILPVKKRNELQI